MGEPFRLTLPPLSGGGRRTRPSLGDFQLRLDPSIEAQLAALRGPGTPASIASVWLAPDWRQLLGMLPTPNPPNPFAMAGVQPRPPVCPVPRGAGPRQSHPAGVSDLLEAVWAVPCVRDTAARHLAAVGRQFSAAPAGERAAIAVAGVVFAAGLLPLGYVSPGQPPFSFVDNQSIPVPGVDGLQFRLNYTGRGAGATWEHILQSPVTVGADVSTSNGPNLQFEIKLDLQRFMPLP